MTAIRERSRAAEIDLLESIEDLLEAETVRASRRPQTDSQYIDGIGIMLVRGNGLQWQRQNASIDAVTNELRTAVESRMWTILKEHSSDYGSIAISDLVPNRDSDANVKHCMFILSQTGSPQVPEFIAWVYAERESSSAFLPSVLRRFETRARYIIRRATCDITPLDRFSEACAVNMLYDALETICEMTQADAAILWQYNGAGREFVSISQFGVQSPREFRLPIQLSPSQSDQRGIVSLVRPERRMICFDLESRDQRDPQLTGSWGPRDQDTFSENRWRSALAVPICSSGYLCGAVSLYSVHGLGGLKPRLESIRPLLSACLQGSLRAREEEARIGLLESRFDEEFEKSAMSLSVLGHAHDLGPAGRSLKISVKDIKDATRTFQDGVLQQRVREIDQTVDALVRISDRIRHYGSPDQRLSRKVSEVDVVLRDLQDYLRFRVAEVGAGHVDLAMSISAADKNEVYSAQIDPLKLERAVANLVENAAHFCKPMKPRGKVSITVRPANSDRWILIHVEDNGPGIATSVSPYIFDKFFTTRPQSHGMGLGLYLTRRFISDGGGRVRSLRRSTGTAFEVSLPPSKR